MTATIVTPTTITGVITYDHDHQHDPRDHRDRDHPTATATISTTAVSPSAPAPPVERFSRLTASISPPRPSDSPPRPSDSPENRATIRFLVTGQSELAHLILLVISDDW